MGGGSFEADAERYDPVTGDDLEEYAAVLGEGIGPDGYDMRVMLGSGGGAASTGIGLASGDPTLTVLGAVGGITGGAIALSGIKSSLRDAVERLRVNLEAASYSVLDTDDAEQLITDSSVIHRYVDGAFDGTPYTHRVRHVVRDGDVSTSLYRPLGDERWHDYELSLMHEPDTGKRTFQHFFGRVEEPEAYISERQLTDIL